MITISEKSQCCGCGACVTLCPVNCVSLVSDDEGFAYPVVDLSRCTDCGLCESACPFLATYTPNCHPQAFAAKHRDESLRLESSSGGAFTALAEQTIQADGVVFGASWDSDWSVSHTYTETIDGLSAFRGSKYLQSRTGESYRQAKTFLDAGRKVLYSGTPCQIAGLVRYLNRPYANLLAVDVVCHGVPSPKVFKTWLHEILNDQKSAQQPSIKAIKFRSKDTPYCWRNAGFAVEYYDGVANEKYVDATFQGAFGRGFLAHLYLRPSCHACVVKGKEYGSDLTLADFWGVERILPDVDDGEGVSLVFVNSEHGRLAFDATVTTSLEVEALEYDDLRKLCAMFTLSAKPHKNRTVFFEDFKAARSSVTSLVLKYNTKPILKKFKSMLSKALRVFKNG